MGLKWVDGKLVDEDAPNYNIGTDRFGPADPNLSNATNYSKLSNLGLSNNAYENQYTLPALLDSGNRSFALKNTQPGSALRYYKTEYDKNQKNKGGFLEKYGITNENLGLFEKGMSGVSSAVDAIMAFKTYGLNKKMIEDNRKLTRANYMHQLGATNYEIREDNAFKNANAMYSSISPELKNAYAT